MCEWSHAGQEKTLQICQIFNPGTLNPDTRSQVAGRQWIGAIWKYFSLLFVRFLFSIYPPSCLAIKEIMRLKGATEEPDAQFTFRGSIQSSPNSRRRMQLKFCL